MADNIAVTPGSGATVATDEIQVAGTNPLGQVQFVKLVDGTLNGTDPVPASSANGLKVDVARLANQYTEGDTDATISGFAALWEDTSDTLRSVSASKPLPVNPVVSDITGAGPFDTVGTSIFPMATPPTGITGLSPLKYISTGTSADSSLIKGSAGQLYWLYAFNTNAAVRYLKLYNLSSAPTVGTSGVYLTLPIPGNSSGTGFVLNLTVPMVFSTGIGIGLTTGLADNNSTAVAANEVVLAGGYK